jgi:excisionase family DNA binding protein
MAKGNGVQRLGSKPLLSVAEAAVMLDIDRSTAYRAIQRGELPLSVHRIGGRLRIPRLAVERLLEFEGADPDDIASDGQFGIHRGLERCPSCGDTLPPRRGGESFAS